MSYPPLTDAHLKLYIKLCVRGEGRGCNDLNPDEVALLTPEQWWEFCFAYHEWCDDLETFAERSHFHMMDFMVTGFIRHILITNYVQFHYTYG